LEDFTTNAGLRGRGKARGTKLAVQPVDEAALVDGSHETGVTAKTRLEKV
jgi:hypothetical protein